ncbi:13871_t:CDS:2 [Cetraspora pellucida]|uniref:13871_t:CDS:1 n=1 Tax=Cetraspora pellucida TaxID=1433469 RepID=A0A9N9FVS0_9GLOM|nr:13871_t:CDS:2 [Cetraspora pellucida]
MTEFNENSSQWNNLKETYDDLLRIFKVPPLKTELQRTNVEIFNCGLVVDLNKLFSDINPKVQIFRIYGDIVRLSNTLEIPPLNGRSVILIAARRIEIEPRCKIIVNYKKSFRIVIYTLEITSELEIIAKNQQKNNTCLLKDIENIGKLYTAPYDEVPKDICIFDNSILKNHSFLKMLRYSLLIASVLFCDKLEIARSILSWIVRITRESEESKELYDYGLTMFTQHNSKDKGKEKNIQFVPKLDMGIYKDRINELVKFAKYHEERYMQILNDQEEIEMLDVSLADRSDMVEMYEILNDKKKSRRESAHTVMKYIENELRRRQENIKSAFNELEKGIKNWIEEQQSEAQKKLFIAVIELSLSVGKIVVQPGGIFSFVDTIKKVTDLVQEALAGVDVEQIGELYKIATDADMKEKFNQLKDLDSQVGKIQEINKELEYHINNANYLTSDTNKEYGNIVSLDINSLAKSLEAHDQKGILLSTEWELTRRRMPVKQKIESAEKNLNSLENFFIFIDAYIKAKVEEIESDEEFFISNLQAEMSERKKDRLKQMIKNRDTKNYADIKFHLIENFINVKFWMMIYMKNYIRAYEYWSLSKSKIELSVLKKFQDHEEDMKKISHELMRAYEQLGCNSDLNWSSIEFKDEKYIEEFKRNRSVIIEIPLNHKKLSNYAYTKLHLFRVYLEGVGSENDIISLYVSNTGTLANRDKENKEYHFRSEPIPTTEFRYRVHSPIEFDKFEKYIDQEHKYCKIGNNNIYIVPTPFCQWKISSLQTDFDLSGLKSIIIHLATYCHLKDGVL